MDKVEGNNELRTVHISEVREKSKKLLTVDSEGKEVMYNMYVCIKGEMKRSKRKRRMVNHSVLESKKLTG